MNNFAAFCGYCLNQPCRCPNLSASGSTYQTELNTPALDALIADIEYAKNNSLLRDNSDPIFFKLAEALTEIRELLKGRK